MINILNTKKIIGSIGTAAILLTVGGTYQDAHAAEKAHVNTTHANEHANKMAKKYVKNVTLSYKDPVTNEIVSKNVNANIKTINYQNFLKIAEKYVKTDHNISKQKAHQLVKDNIETFNVTYLQNDKTYQQVVSKKQPKLNKKYDTDRTSASVKVTYMDPKTNKKKTTDVIPSSKNITSESVIKPLVRDISDKKDDREGIEQSISNDVMKVEYFDPVTNKTVVKYIVNGKVVDTKTIEDKAEPVTTPTTSKVTTNAVQRYTKPFEANPTKGITYNFGQGYYSSGWDDGFNIAKKIPNSDIDIKRLGSKSNIAAVASFSNASHTGTYSYGTGTAIGKHSILTAAHVVDNMNVTKKAFSKTPVSYLEVQPNRNGNTVPTHLTVDRVDMLNKGDVAVVHTKEDVSKYIPVRKVASESTIKNLKSKQDLYVNHYGWMQGDKYHDNNQYSNVKQTPYRSHIKFISHATNIHPVGYVKGYLYAGSSGSSFLTPNNEVTGVYTNGYTDDEPQRAHYGSGFMFINDLYKQVQNQRY